MYADYEFYESEYLGTALDEDDFPAYALKATSFIDYATMGRARRHSEMVQVKMCCCALAEQYQIIDTAIALSQAALSAGATAVSSSTSGELASQTVGGWSKSYRSGGDSAKSALTAVESARAMLDSIAEQYLAMTGLLRARGYHA